MFSSFFWKDTAERAVKTFAQVAATFLVIGTTGVLDVDWVQVASISGAAALASVLSSLASFGVGTEGTASLVVDDER